jgi:probable F420-dependent oxidoreductase
VEIGAVLPQGRLLLDRGAVRAYAQAVQDLGYTYVFAFDHVLGVDPATTDGRDLPFTNVDPFHEPLTTFAFMTACAPELGFCTGVLILPQRQTALVAKQAAEVDFLSGGRLRLGIGSGWNEAEYEALGVPWTRRGSILDEQIETLRLLWTRESTEYRGDYHQFAGVGINPLPVQRPIPLWIGGRSRRALRRAALVGDGYLVPGQPPPDPDDSDWPALFADIRRMRAEAGLATETYGFEARPVPVTPDGWEDSVRAWERIGTTHVSVTTLGDLRGKPGERENERQRDAQTTVDDHIRELDETRSALARFFPAGTS